jgi:CheY-like chemotaxis protein/anti-sigma regulatory factor (Ser/Thr protein kinase)
MFKILVVEDSVTQATQIRFMLEEAGYACRLASDGVEALEQLQTAPPDIVLTDLRMPNMDGLELVGRVRAEYQSIPVLLMTNDGTEAIAYEALQKGAASYIPKQFLESSLLTTIQGIADLLQAHRSKQRVLASLVETRSRFLLHNDPQLVPALVQHIEEELRAFNYGDETGVFQLSMAITEATINAMDHGNLELSSSLRSDSEAYATLRQERRRTAPYCERRVGLIADFTSEAVSITVSDEGQGFDPACIPDPTDPENLMRENGRGLMLIYSFMDEVHHNDRGNEITMVKHRHQEAVPDDEAPPAERTADPEGRG